MNNIHSMIKEKNLEKKFYIDGGIPIDCILKIHLDKLGSAVKTDNTDRICILDIKKMENLDDLRENVNCLLDILGYKRDKREVGISDVEQLSHYFDWTINRSICYRHTSSSSFVRIFEEPLSATISLYSYTSELNAKLDGKPVVLCPKCMSSSMIKSIYLFYAGCWNSRGYKRNVYRIYKNPSEKDIAQYISFVSYSDKYREKDTERVLVVFEQLDRTISLLITCQKGTDKYNCLEQAHGYSLVPLYKEGVPRNGSLNQFGLRIRETKGKELLESFYKSLREDLINTEETITEKNKIEHMPFVKQEIIKQVRYAKEKSGNEQKDGKYGLRQTRYISSMWIPRKEIVGWEGIDVRMLDINDSAIFKSIIENSKAESTVRRGTVFVDIKSNLSYYKNKCFCQDMLRKSKYLLGSWLCLLTIYFVYRVANSITHTKPRA